MTKKNINVLLVSSVSSQGGFDPVPPIQGYAPHWNAYRLAEGLAGSTDVNITVVSPCTAQQYAILKSVPAKGNYKWIIYSSLYVTARYWLKEAVPILRGIIAKAEGIILRSTVQLSLWTFYNYLKRVQRLPAYLKADLIIQNDMPQLLSYYVRRVPREKLVFFCRGQIGATGRPVSKHTITTLAGCGAILVADEPMIGYIQQLLDSYVPRERQPRLYVVPNGLGPEFSSTQLAFNRSTNSNKKILFAGRICEDKGVRELIMAFIKVHKHHPEITLRIVGAAQFNSKSDNLMSPYELEIRELLATLPPDAVELAGYVRYQDMAEEYTAAYIAVFPSIIIEGFGMVALEAMRCGLPVVASNRPGFRELVVDEETGFLVDPINIDQLANALIRLVEDPDLALRMGRNGYQRSLNYTVERMANSFTEFALDFWTGQSTE